MSGTTSHREILRSSTIVGGASLVSLLLSLLRMKAAALIVGPAGVGIIGLLQNFLAAGSTIAGLGLGGAATRQLAAERAEKGAAGVAEVRRALFWAGLLLATATVLLLLAFRRPLTDLIFPGGEWSDAMPWLAAGVVLTMAAALQIGVLTGLRRIGDVARINIVSGLVATIVGVAALALLGAEGVLAFVLVVPVAGALAGWLYLRRLPCDPLPSPTHVFHQWRALLPLGTAIMLGGLLTTGGQLTVRTMVGDELGVAALGYFHAAWTISMTYLGLVLQAMGTDFYPRLTERIREPVTAGRLVAEQTEVALLLGAPILLAVMGAAPLVVQSLYAADFAYAADILRWQILGDLLKIAAWPLGFVLLAAGRSQMHIGLEALAQVAFVGATAALLPLVGVAATGIGFLAMYAVYLPAVAWAAHGTLGSSAHLRSLRPLAWMAFALLLVMAAAWASSTAALLTGGLLSMGSAAMAYRKLHHALPTSIAAPLQALRNIRRAT